MSNRSKFWRLAALVPEVQCPDQPISPRQKFKYTAIVLFIFVTASQVLLYGIQHQPRTIEPDPLHWLHLILASSRSTLLSHGIVAILVPEVLVKIWVYLKIITLDTSAPETGVLMNRAQRLLGILVAILGAVNFYVRSQHFTVNTVLIMLQILCSDIIVIYLDDVLRKGYGFVNILWKAFSPMSVMYPEQSPEFEGAVIAWVHLLMTRTDKLSAMSKAFYRQNLPNIINFLATCLFVPLAIFFQGFYIVLPVRTRRNFQAYCHIKLSHFLYGPVVLHRLLLPLPYVASKVLYKKYSGNTLVNLLGKWDGLNHFGQSIPVGGIMQEERRLRLAQPDSIHANEIRRHVMRAACVGGFCAGVLIIFADLIGVFCSGTGIMLAVTASYPYVDGRASEVGSFGF
uniref:Translocon Sec61/SecY plug domain-containing protein n=1 Tax=Oryza glumipatula TaxID=40148 RepID=A0A0E0B567_9ORYZ